MHARYPDDDDNGGGMSTGTKAGIAIAIVVAVIGIVAVVVFLRRRKPAGLLAGDYDVIDERAVNPFGANRRSSLVRAAADGRALLLVHSAASRDVGVCFATCFDLYQSELVVTNKSARKGIN